ncbi:mercury(II) reductase [Halobacteriales archaeon QS_1_68_20]|nr:MAG: mercury(II) reductase [Halobacteriales archaeon QS_1_68_20]
MSRSDSYDLVVLGGGAAAFGALTEASERDRSVAVVNAGLPLGGTCVNVGCVPSKHLLEVGKTAFEPSHNPFDAVRHGESTTDWATAIDDMDALVETLREENYVDVAEHFGVDVYEGYGAFVDEQTVEVTSGPDEGARIAGEAVLVATGSSPRAPPVEGLDDVDYETSESILQRRERPDDVVVLGGGYVGVEWAQILHHLGAEVTVLQRSDRVLSDMPHRVGRTLGASLRAGGIDVVTGVDARRVEETPDGVVVEAAVDGERREFAGTDLFLAAGVRPNTAGIGLADVGVETDETGAVVVETYHTGVADVYAAGDVIGDPMLETVAAKEGNYAVRNAFGDGGHEIEYDAVPSVVFTSPEVASVGRTESEYAREHGTCSCRTVELDSLPRARAAGKTRGFLQVVKHHETDEIVGVHAVSPRAGDVIPAAALAVKYGLTVDDVIDTVHPFPTYGEAFKRACQAFRRDTSTMSCCVE